MARIKKKGLDYFPISSDFIQGIAMRRLMKSEGDGAMAVIMNTLNYIYTEEGYYSVANDRLYDAVADYLYEKGADYVERVIRLAVKEEVFDATLFEQYGILTSAEIQRQYLFSKRRIKSDMLKTEYCLVRDEEEMEKPSPERKQKTETVWEPMEMKMDKGTFSGYSVAKMGQNVAKIPENVARIPHSIAQHSIEKQSIAQSPSDSPSKTSGERRPEEEPEEEYSGGINREAERQPPQNSAPRRMEWTQEAIDRLVPPADGIRRNYPGLLETLRQFRIPPAEQYVLIVKSNYGVIGHPIWRGLSTLHECGGKIKLPGHYLMSVINKRL